MHQVFKDQNEFEDFETSKHLKGVGKMKKCNKNPRMSSDFLCRAMAIYMRHASHYLIPVALHGQKSAAGH